MAKKTSAMGESNPLKNTRDSAKMVQTDEPERAKVRMNSYLDADLVEYLRDAIHATGNQFTIGDVIGQGLPYALGDMEKEYNNGEQFPRRPKEATKLPVGRPRNIPSRDRA